MADKKEALLPAGAKISGRDLGLLWVDFIILYLVLSIEVVYEHQITPHGVADGKHGIRKGNTLSKEQLNDLIEFVLSL